MLRVGRGFLFSVYGGVRVLSRFVCGLFHFVAGVGGVGAGGAGRAHRTRVGDQPILAARLLGT